jgi:two-component system nitrogen regulation sensor histidine kinase NtrY
MTNKAANSSLSSLISLIFFYFFLIFLMVLFASQVLNRSGAENSLYVAILWFTALVVPIVLLFSIISNILRLLRERSRNAPGVVLKTRLVLYFLLIVFISAVPQAILSMSFIRVIGDTWFNDEIGEGLRSSLDITVGIQETLVEDLRDFVYNPLFESLADDRAWDNPERLFVQLRQIRPSVDALQVFDDAGSQRYFGGEEAARVAYADIEDSPEGLVIRDIRGERSFIRIRRSIIAGPDRPEEPDLIAVVMEELPEGFGAKTLQIVSALELFSQYQDIRNLLYTGIAVFYGVFALPLIFLAILTAFYLSDLLIQPIANLEDATRRIAEGDFSFRILSRSREDLGHLVESFNGMIAELERSRNQLRQSERVSAWKDIAQRLAHEIKNPLTPIKLSAERLRRRFESGAENFAEVLDGSVKTITREVDHLSGLLTEFRDFARLPFPQPRMVNLKLIIEDVLDIHKGSDMAVQLEDIGDDTQIYVDPDQFRQVLGNLVKNAGEAMEGGRGELRFQSRILSASGKRFQRISIQDNGSGISPEAQSEIFNPYFTTKAEGTGLGLAIVQRIIQDHNGDIRVESEPGNGCRFYIDLPLPED